MKIRIMSIMIATIMVVMLIRIWEMMIEIIKIIVRLRTYMQCNMKHRNEIGEMRMTAVNRRRLIF